MEYNDYELVYLAQEHNELANDILCRKYNMILESKARRVLNLLKPSGFELNDIFQEALIAFGNAIMSYNQDDKATFYSFANLCVERRLITMIRDRYRKKYSVLNDSVIVDLQDETNNIFSNDLTPEKEVFNKEKLNNLYDFLEHNLSDLEFNVFKLKMYGATNKEISDRLGIDSKLVYTIINKIKKRTEHVIFTNKYF